MQETENYYKQYFGCDVNVTDGYIVKGRWTTTKGFDYDVVFPIVKIENEGLKISPYLWHLNQGKPIQWLSTSGYGPNHTNSYPIM